VLGDKVGDKRRTGDEIGALKVCRRKVSTSVSSSVGVDTFYCTTLASNGIDACVRSALCGSAVRGDSVKDRCASRSSREDSPRASSSWAS
jgi:hypothetical protein